MKTSPVTDALVAHLVGVRKLAELLAPATASGQVHPLVLVIREALDSAITLAGAVAEDAHTREAAATAARDDSAKVSEREPPPVFGASASPQPAREPAPTGRGVVSIDDVLASADGRADAPAVPAGSP